MALLSKNLKIFLKEKQLILRIVLLLFILIFLFSNAFILLSKDFSVSVDSTNNFYAQPTPKSLRVFRNNKKVHNKDSIEINDNNVNNFVT